MFNIRYLYLLKLSILKMQAVPVIDVPWAV